MNDEFQALINKIESLQVQHRDLETELPRLTELKRQAGEELSTLNGQLIDLMTQIERAKEELASTRAKSTDAEGRADEAEDRLFRAEIKLKDIAAREDALATRQAELDKREAGIQDKEAVKRSHVV